MVSAPAPTPIDVLRYRYYEALLRTDITGAVKVQPEAITRTLAPADPGRAAAWAFDQEVASVVTPDGGDEGDSILLAGIPLPYLEAEAVRFVRSLIHPAEDSREVPDLTRDLARLTQALRRWAGLSDGESPSSNDATGRPVRRTLAAGATAVARVCRRRSVRGAPPYRRRSDQPIPSSRCAEGGCDRAPADRSCRLPGSCPPRPRTRSRCRIRGTSGARAGAAGSCEALARNSRIGDLSRGAAEELRMGSTGAWARLHLNSRLVEALLGTRGGYTYLGTLGPYRRDLARFHSRLLSLARDAGLTPQVTLRVGSKVYRATSVRLHGRHRHSRLACVSKGRSDPWRPRALTSSRT